MYVWKLRAGQILVPLKAEAVDVELLLMDDTMLLEVKGVLIALNDVELLEAVNDVLDGVLTRDVELILDMLLGMLFDKLLDEMAPVPALVLELLGSAFAVLVKVEEAAVVDDATEEETVRDRVS